MKLVSFSGVLVMAVMAAGASEPRTIYVDAAVDASAEDYATREGKGTAANNAFATIQEGVDDAASGDTVIVAAGDYITGSKSDDFGHVNRVLIDKSITLMGAEGGEKPRIIGAFDTTSEMSATYATAQKMPQAAGPNAVRCLAVIGNVSPTIKNFVFTHGACGLEDSNPGDKPIHSGGGVLVRNGSDYSTKAIFVDCVISNCCATRGGGARGGTFIRCKFLDNQAYIASAMRNGVIHFSLIAGNGTANSSAAVGFMVGVSVNNTFVGNAVRPLGNDSKAHVNSIFLQNEYISMKQEVMPSYFTNCLLSASTVDSDKNWWNTGYGCDLIYATGDDKQFVAPAFEDYRIISTSGALNAGTKYKDVLKNIPEGYRDRDIDGNAIDEEHLSLGCYQVPVTPKSAMITFNRPATGAPSPIVNGKRLSTNKYVFLYAYDDTYPRWWVIEPQNNDAGFPIMFTSFTTSDNKDSFRLYPQWKDKKIHFLLPPKDSLSLTATVTYPTQIKWADANADYTKYDGDADGTAEKPFKTLKEAVTAAGVVNTIIYAKKGRYDQGEMYGIEHTNRVCLASDQNVALIGVEGAEKTFIVGASANGEGANGYGCGTNAVRCVAVENHGLIQGFTLTDGRASVSTNDKDLNCVYAGGFMSMSSLNAVLADCVVSNCVGSRAGAIYSGTIQRCLITKCRATNNSIVRQGNWSSCFFRHNFGKESGCTEEIAYANLKAHRVCHCSGVGEPTQKTYLAATQAGQLTVCNSIFMGYYYAKSKQNSDSVGNFAWDVSISSVYTDQFTYTDPYVVSKADCDMHLYAHSPAIRGAKTTAITDYWRYMTTDFEGNVYPFFTEEDGSITTIAGAFAVPRASIVIEGDVFTPLGNMAAGAEGTEHEFTLAEDVAATLHTRPFLGVTTNGVFEPFMTSFTYTTPAGIQYAPFKVDATLVTGTNWYVDVAKENDGGYGSTWENARRTLTGVLTNAIAGDCVHVARGTYDEGSLVKNLSTENDVLPSRAVIPDGVTMVSEEGAGKTFIVGESAPSDHPTYVEGCGVGAMRCVKMGRESRLIGFTIKGGRTMSHYASDGAGGWVANKTDQGWRRAAGVFGATEFDKANRDYWPIVSDCVITNCVGSRGGGGFACIFVRTEFVGNGHLTEGNGAAARTSFLYDCRIHGNDCNTSEPLYLIYALYGCTIGPADGNSTESQSVDMHINYNFGVGNNIFLGGAKTTIEFGATSDGYSAVISNCFMRGDYAIKTTTKVTDLVTNNIQKNVALVTDSKGRLLVNTASARAANAVALDSAVPIWDEYSAGLMEAWGGVDLDQNPRILNRYADAGCYEADWKDVYAANLGRGITVTAASWDARDDGLDDGTGEVELVDGANLALTCTPATQNTHTFNVNVNLTGTGTLTIMKGEEVLAAVTEAGAKTISFKDKGAQDLSFAYASDAGGTAEILGVDQVYGTVLFIR